ncbi:MAG: heavy metal-responsive transcriptional regulator [Cyanobacteria bacterium J06600_6]
MEQVDYSQNYLKIGQLAKQTNLTVGTLRYYSDLELLQPIYRGENGYRYYHLNAKEQVEFIKKAQRLGFSLEEIKQILVVRDRGEQPCNLVKNLLSQKISEIDRQIEQMTAFRTELANYRLEWSEEASPQSESESPCPLIARVSLSKDSAES